MVRHALKILQQMIFEQIHLIPDVTISIYYCKYLQDRTEKLNCNSKTSILLFDITMSNY